MTGLFITLLAVLFLSTAIRDPKRSDRTPAQLAATVRRAGWLGPAWWLLCFVVGGLAVVLWYACRFGLYAAAYLLAVVSVRVASVAALDGRGLRLHRLEGGRA